MPHPRMLLSQRHSGFDMFRAILACFLEKDETTLVEQHAFVLYTELAKSKKIVPIIPH